MARKTGQRKHLLDILFRRQPTTNNQRNPSIQVPPTDNNIPLLIQHHIPIYSPNNLPPGHRPIHTLIKVPSTISLADLRFEIELALSDAGNPNSRGERVGRLRVCWGRHGRLGRGFPASTVLCEENLEAALLFLGEGRGYDFIEVAVDLA